MRDHLGELAGAFRAGGDLRAKVGDVLIDVTRGKASFVQNRADLRVEKATLCDKLDVVEQHTFFVDVRRIGRHRPGRDPANIGVMTPRCDVELRPLVPALSPRAGRGCPKGR